jgi:phosphotransferase system  glucose/maltose/N-acetylglucosamine-specific IIC component
MTAVAPENVPPATGSVTRILAVLQRIGRSLMLPIAVLPVAALLLRFGQADMLGADGLGQYIGFSNDVAKVLAAGGGVLFSNLPMLFAVGVAIGFARRSDGSTALSALVGYLVFDMVTRTLFAGSSIRTQVVSEIDGTAEVLNLAKANPTGVLGGILIGITAAMLWQRYHRKKLAPYLAFFGGRRFVPIVTALAAVIIAVVMGLVWAPIGRGLEGFGNWLTDNGELGAGVYGVSNRALLPFGLHHIINSLVWFTFGTFTDASGNAVTGDLNRFFAGDPNGGVFTAGFFPVMMFGLPAAALAIWRAARPERRAAVGGIMFSAAFASFLTGVTEPIEFSFLFVAPLLYAIHAVLTGVSLALSAALGIRDSFGFSAGFIDFALNWGKATRPELLLIMGVIYGAVYYAVFTFAIRAFNLMTPGREPDDDQRQAIEAETAPATVGDSAPAATEPAPAKPTTP